MRPPAAGVCGVEDIFGGRGQSGFLADGESGLVPREDEQRVDEVPGMIHFGADVRDRGAQFAGRAAGAAQQDVDGGANDGQRGAQFVGCVGDEPLLALGIRAPDLCCNILA